MTTALKIVSRPPFFEEEVEFYSTENSEGSHSLHALVPLPGGLRPEIAAFFIDKYSSKDDVVLDPWCRTGATPLEAVLRGRVAYGSDTDALALKVARAKLAPADLAMATLNLQLANLRHPVPLEAYKRGFAPFFDVDTFRELSNLRRFIQGRYEPVTGFIEAIALGILHGPSAGYCSVYTFPQVSIAPEEQERLNAKRRQYPEYRAVVPRVLRKIASVWRDGFPSMARRVCSVSRLAHADAVNLSFLPEKSIDLVVSHPPHPGLGYKAKEMWLRGWFACVDECELVGPRYEQGAIEEWSEYMNSSLLELARVVRRGGRVVLDLREIPQPNGSTVCLDELITELVNDHLARFWDTEGLFIQREQFAKLKDALKSRNPAGVLREHRVLVLRRR
jgi:SAM-dependent methyltransferase